MKSKIDTDLSFKEELAYELSAFSPAKDDNEFSGNNRIKMDLHCHDHNSDVPDELLGRILNIPETWLKTDRLIETLSKNNCNAITITNHNNARSCWELKERGEDVLVGAEFSCTVPDFNIGIHVLTYGFNEKQEHDLNKLRRNIYAFRDYTVEHDIPVIWAHPLYHYASGKSPSIEFFNKMSLLFDNYETLNGQRDAWQNMLVKVWLESLTPGMIDETAKKTGLRADLYCRHPYKKSLSGGSDSHMGIFAGSTGSYLYVPDLTKRLTKETASQLALEAIKKGEMKPYGSFQNSEKLMITLLDYVCQIAINMKDPGLLRILLHKGTMKDKFMALIVSNAFAELQRHKVTMNFIKLFHNCFEGNPPVFIKRLFISKDYKPVFDDALAIAETSKNSSKNIVKHYNDSIYSINNKLNKILYSRLEKKINNLKQDNTLADFGITKLLEKFEMPSDIRSYINNKNDSKKNRDNEKRINNPDMAEFLDGLSFPFLASSLILAANFTSAKVMYNDRPLLREFSNDIGRLKHPERMLWLTDTFDYNNGVSMVLKAMHQEIKERDLPIDIMVCSNTIKSDDHLIVMKPLSEFSIPFYKEQPVRIPNFMDIHRIFQEGSYDRIICSTEGIMGLTAIYLKNAFTVKAHFFIHTDWLIFAKKVLNIDRSNINRLRRLLRFYYKAFDNVFVLNTDQQKWLTGRDMGFDSANVRLTAHWVDDIFHRQITDKTEIFNIPNNIPVILFAGRLSYEKGVMELPEIYSNIKKKVPQIKMIIAGTGPAEEEMRKSMPDAIFLGWVAHHKLPFIYSAADILVLPSKFDTFSCVVLEALSCGLPVVAYKAKGPKDIIRDGKCGYIVSSKQEMCEMLIAFFKDVKLQKSFGRAAIKRSKDYDKENIMKNFLIDVGF